MLEAEDHNVQILARELARELGATLTKREMTKAAMVIAAHLVGLDGPGAFDSRLYPTHWARQERLILARVPQLRAILTKIARRFS